LTVNDFLRLSWYEADLIAQRFDYQDQRQWRHTRMIVSALTGEAQSTIAPLPLFDNQQNKLTAPTDEQSDEIINKYQHFFNR
jgi:hypothetical protein